MTAIVACHARDLAREFTGAKDGQSADTPADDLEM
jgi:hypothetical protein